MNHDDASPEQETEKLNLERLIAITHDENKDDSLRDFWEKVHEVAYEEVAFFRDAINEGLKRTYAKMTLQEKIAATRHLLEKKQHEKEALQKLCADIQEKLNEFKRLANE